MTRTPTRIAAAGLVAAVAGIAAAPASGVGSERADREVEVMVIEHDGFRWEDAGIGALAAVGLTLVAAGTAIALRGGARDRDRPTRGVRK